MDEVEQEVMEMPTGKYPWLVHHIFFSSLLEDTQEWSSGSGIKT